ncbi:MAG: acetylornithine deacetylase [Methylobacteriaceae bacterium]|jgi:acetylornithine deacetylase|nr:acetylornithine deacetylase [Methylobacteriaceae bacterium]
MTPVTSDALARTLPLIERLVGFDTESSKSNLPLIEFVEDYLRQLNVPFVRVPNDDGNKAAIFATVGPMQDGGVVLSGHTDVVPVAGQAWSSDPFAVRRDSTRLYGRGTCDMKGFDATCLAMVPEFQRATLKRPVHLLFSYDEEVTCEGSLDAIRRFGHDLPTPGIVIVGEPTNMEVADSHKSVSTYHTHVRGHEAHSSKPFLGVSAVHVGCELVTELTHIAEDFARIGDPSGRFEPAYSTVHVGTISGGTARNILAKDCKFHWEFRGLPGVPLRAALERFEVHVEQLRAAQLKDFADTFVDTLIEVEVPGLASDPGSPAEALALRLTRSNRTIAVPFATEAGQFQEAGIPTIVCGPGNVNQAHQPDEFIEIAEIEKCISFLRALTETLG